MNKTDFLQALRAELESLPEAERERSVSFYAEAIDDRIEDGMSEEDAVQAIGSVDEVAEQIMLDTPLPVLMRSRANTGSKTLNIVLAIVGFPIWLPLLLVFTAVVLCIYAVIWICVAVLWMIVLAIALAGLACIAAFFILLFKLPFAAWISPVLSFAGAPVALACGFVLSGLAIFMFFPALYATKGMVKLTKLIARGIKRLFIKKKGGAK